MTYNPVIDPRDPRIISQEVTYSEPVGVPMATTQLEGSMVVTPRDRVRWGPILAGLFSTIATLLILSLLGIAIGLTAATGDPNGGATAATNNANNYGLGAAIWAAASALISFFIGGYIAARTAAVYGKGYGWVNGALVWAVAIPVLLLLASTGASGFLNGIGFNLEGFFDTVNPANPASPVNNATAQTTAETARNGAWGALAALLLGLLASGLGGLLGGRSEEDLSRDTLVVS